MSYLQKIATTLIENSRTQQRQASWPMVSRPTKAAYHSKLIKYHQRAGGWSLAIDARPSVMGVNAGWLGKKKKDQCLALDRIELGTKRPKVSRRTHSAITWRLMSLKNLVRQNVVPVGVEMPILLDGYEQVRVIRNHKTGSLTFTGRDLPPVTVTIRENMLLNADQALAAWDCLTRTKSNGDVVSYLTPNRWSSSK